MRRGSLGGTNDRQSFEAWSTAGILPGQDDVQDGTPVQYLRRGSLGPAQDDVQHDSPVHKMRRGSLSQSAVQVMRRGSLGGTFDDRQSIEAWGPAGTLPGQDK
jgi:hypothetical protein